MTVTGPALIPFALIWLLAGLYVGIKHVGAERNWFVIAAFMLGGSLYLLFILVCAITLAIYHGVRFLWMLWDTSYWR